MPVNIGVVGCGTVSQVYLRNLLQFPDLRVLACADADIGRARALAEQFDIPVVADVDQVVQHPDVEVVLNLTNPLAHTEVSLAAIAAGKHVYTEKPLALTVEAGLHLVAEAAAAGVELGVAPDTYLGAGLQSAVRLIREGAIGEPLTAVTMMLGPGPEAWHPNPAFLYQPGGGPLFDMGPYNLTVLASIFGPASRVVATTRRAKPVRTVGSGPLMGQTFPVDVPTHYTLMVDFAAGQSATATFSFDSPVHRFDFLEITGTEATLSLPNPNMYEGRSQLRRAGDTEWTTVADPAAEGKRGIGVLEFARAIRSGRPARTSPANALHVLEIMSAAEESAKRFAFVDVRTGFEVPELLPEAWAPEDRTLA